VGRNGVRGVTRRLPAPAFRSNDRVQDPARYHHRTRRRLPSADLAELRRTNAKVKELVAQAITAR